MKTTLEIPDDIFREAKATAARQGRSLKEFLTEAIQQKLQVDDTVQQKPWMKFYGCMKDDPEMRKELRRISKVIEREFGQVDQKDWA